MCKSKQNSKNFPNLIFQLNAPTRALANCCFLRLVENHANVVQPLRVQIIITVTQDFYQRRRFVALLVSNSKLGFFGNHSFIVKNPCDLPMVEGFGSGAMTRYYFNKRDRQCLSFIYHGIGGNQVREVVFRLQLICLRTTS